MYDTNRRHYAGICIGGPLDGQMVIREHPTMTVSVHAPLPKASAFRYGGVEPVSINNITYTHRDLVKDLDGVKVEAWVPNNMTGRQAIEHVFLEYQYAKSTVLKAAVKDKHHEKDADTKEVKRR